MDLISVIVPVYNVKKYLGKCIESLLSQTYANFELILVNDGSTDGSDLICKEYKRKDDRICIIDKANGGLSSARNAGIDVCKGKYVCFVDSDDFVSETYLEYLYQMIIKDDSQIAICSACWWVDENSYEHCYFEQEICLKPDASYKLLFSKEKWFGVFAWNKLYKTELFNNIRYPEGYYFEDSGTTYKLIHKCEKISFGYEPQYFYRQQREGQITAVFNTKKIDDKLLFLDEMYAFFFARYSNIMDEYISYYLNCLITIYGIVIQDKPQNREDANRVRSLAKSLTRKINKKKLTKKVKVKLAFFDMGDVSFSIYLWLNRIRRKTSYGRKR